jgi:hypothetical protein
VRIAGAFLLLIGLVAALVGTFSGCSTLFTWNGRHAIDTVALPEGPFTHTIVPEPGRRYTLSIEVVFDREDLPRHEGTVVVEAKMPLVARVKDDTGTTRAEVVGWLDPNEPPNVLFGASARESMRGPSPELVVSRIVGPFSAARAAPLVVEVNIGADRVGTAKIVARRLVVHDDAIPASIRNAFVLGVSGIVAMAGGIAFLVLGFFRRRRIRSKTRLVISGANES